MSELVAAFRRKEGTFHSFPWTLVWLWPGLIKEIVLFMRNVCTCSSTSLTTLINCMLCKSRLGSSLTIETKVEGHAVRTTLQIRALCHWMLSFDSFNSIIYTIPSPNKSGFLTLEDKEEKVQGREMAWSGGGSRHTALDVLTTHYTVWCVRC